MSGPRLCLASASPRRLELLASIGLDVITHVADIDETPWPDESPDALVVRLAEAKVAAVSTNRRVAGEEALLPVLGADTVVVCDEQIFGKPRDQAEGAWMLRQLSGRRHQVITGVAVSGPQGLLSLSVTTHITLRQLADDEISSYWATGEPRDKAGGFAIQGRGALFVSHLEGSYSAVVGLPLFETAQLLSHQGVALWA
ncbi:Maf family protein [Halomonas halocynthiae]|uniref:Maf family protein n=1 Tax=Halomonas halocynthiae TaxID=176290 RepID=UPI000413496A|nr:Maf family protein [Halomonas halocynthiae]